MKMWEKALASYGLHTEPEPAKHPLYDPPAIREIYLNATPYVVERTMDMSAIARGSEQMERLLEMHKDCAIRDLCDGIKDHIEISVDQLDHEYGHDIRIRAQINIATKG